MVKKNEVAELKGNCGVWGAIFTLKWGRPLEYQKTYDHPIHKDYKLDVFTYDFETDKKEETARKIRHADWVEAVNRQEDPNWKKDKDLISGEYKSSEKGDYEKILEEIEAIKKDRTKPLELKQKDMQKIFDDIQRKSDETISAINEHVEKKQEEVTKKAQELTEAKNRNDQNKMKEISALIHNLQVDMVEANRTKANLVTVEELKKYLEENQKFWFQSIDLKSSATYLYAFSFLAFIFLVFTIFALIFQKIKSFVSSGK
jgi:hypothetical protein